MSLKRRASNRLQRKQSNRDGVQEGTGLNKEDLLNRVGKQTKNTSELNQESEMILARLRNAFASKILNKRKLSDTTPSAVEPSQANDKPVLAIGAHLDDELAAAVTAPEKKASVSVVVAQEVNSNLKKQIGELTTLVQSLHAQLQQQESNFEQFQEGVMLHLAKVKKQREQVKEEATNVEDL